MLVAAVLTPASEKPAHLRTYAAQHVTQRKNAEAIQKLTLAPTSLAVRMSLRIVSAVDGIPARRDDGIAFQRR